MKEISWRHEKDGKVSHHFYDARADYVISEDIDDLFEVFGASYDPDLAFKAVGGADLFSYEKQRFSGEGYNVETYMRTDSLQVGRDKKTYATLLRSEQHRRSVFNNSFFQ